MTAARMPFIHEEVDAMKTPLIRVTRLNRRARILLAAGGAVLVIVLVAVALLAFDPPLLVRLTRHLPGAATPVCTPGDNCPGSCVTQTVPTTCGQSCAVARYGSCAGFDLTYVLSNGLLVLENSRLDHCNLEGSTLSGSLRGAHLKGANLTGADLTDADLTDANLTDAETSYTVWNDAKFCRTKMPNGTVKNRDCR